MPLIVILGASLIGWRMADHAGEELAGMATKALPWVAGAAGLYLLTRRR